ncbi:hypothetical protein [Streptomyces sp. BE230]|uniref:hypothetical protein n=1 Tax=Streptomyces sp. BE230 TaxID=3002526 RepID=UPI002ED01D21|nr:hypothetical protein [Streptomyces sp. BE230]
MNKSRFAVIATDHFARSGNQWAAVFDGEERLTPDEASINQALAALGVRPTASTGEFDMIGPGRFRSNPDCLDAYVGLCEELGV